MAEVYAVARKLDRAGELTLAGALGDTPETVAAVHGLTHGFYEAWTIGEPWLPEAALVRPRILETMAVSFGQSPAALAELLLRVPGWTSALTDASSARLAGELVARATGEELTYEDDICYLPGGVIPEFGSPHVRLVGRDEFDVLGWVMEWGFTRERLEHILHNGIIACAIEDGNAVCAAYTDGWTARYAELTVGTDGDWRNHGLATAASSLVARKVAADGRTPVWSTSADNPPSQRIAAKLGFAEVSRRVSIVRAHS